MIIAPVAGEDDQIGFVVRHRDRSLHPTVPRVPEHGLAEGAYVARRIVDEVRVAGAEVGLPRIIRIRGAGDLIDVPVRVRGVGCQSDLTTRCHSRSLRARSRRRLARLPGALRALSRAELDRFEELHLPHLSRAELERVVIDEQRCAQLRRIARRCDGQRRRDGRGRSRRRRRFRCALDGRFGLRLRLGVRRHCAPSRFECRWPSSAASLRLRDAGDGEQLARHS